jgi:hypothetical protein
MLIYDPRLFLYKPGYKVLSLQDLGDYKDDYTPKSTDTSIWNGRTIKMEPLGPHYFALKDNYVQNLDDYGYELLAVAQGQHPRTCFWGVVRPAISLLMREERRLSAYSQYGSTSSQRWLQPHPKSDDSCGPTQEDVAQLEAEANTVEPETPLFPLIDGRPRRVEDGPIKVPSEWQTGAKEAFVYHVVIDHKDPYFLQVFQELPSRFISGEEWTWQRLNPRILHNESGGYWVVSLVPWRGSSPPLPGEYFNPGNYYNPSTRSWEITEGAFVLPSGASEPVLVEIDSDVPTSITTSLVPAGQNRWVLPSFADIKEKLKARKPAAFTIDITAVVGSGSEPATH